MITKDKYTRWLRRRDLLEIKILYNNCKEEKINNYKKEFSSLEKKIQQYYKQRSNIKKKEITDEYLTIKNTSYAKYFINTFDIQLGNPVNVGI